MRESDLQDGVEAIEHTIIYRSYQLIQLIHSSRPPDTWSDNLVDAVEDWLMFTADYLNFSGKSTKLVNRPY